MTLLHTHTHHKIQISNRKVNYEIKHKKKILADTIKFPNDTNCLKKKIKKKNHKQ